MDETDENISADDASMVEGPSSVKVKPKKRSLVERELETSLTARVTSPVTNGDTCSTSRYGRARRLKTDPESIDPEKILKQMKSPTQDVTPVKMQSPVYKMHASNSPIKQEPKETPKKLIETDSSLQNQIENIYHENISLSRFGSDEKKKSPGSKFPKVYVRKDLIQKREKEDTVVLIKNMFSPVQSPYKSTNSHLNNILERSSEKYHLNTASKSHNGYGNTSVVKTLDFDSSKKKKKENRDNKVVLSKSDLFDMEAKCEYQVGDLAWARMGTYPFWPCIVTREPSSGMFVKKKLFGRIERDIVHVTFFGDNGRRGWIVDTMLRRFLGQLEFEATRERFSPTAKKRDPRLYAAYFISEKKMPQWTISVEEAEMLLREPKRLRIDLLNDMLMKSRVTKATSKSHKSGKITRTASDVSLSESLYDTLFSEDDGKAEDPERSRSKTRKSLDVSEVVTACLDNMAAKTGITKIQRQSHMDRWLQKAKSKTPEKLQNKLTPQKKEKEVKVISSKKKKVSPIVPKLKPYSFRKSVNESRNLKSHHNEHDYSTKANNNDTAEIYIEALAGGCGIGVIAKVESLSEKEDSKDDSEVQTIGEVIAVEEALTSTTDKDIVIQDNVEIAPIVSDDNTVDEIQVNLSVEEDVQIENCLEPEQILESNVADEQKPIEGTTEEPSKEVENVMVGSAKAIETMEVDGDENVSLTSPSFEELVNENTTVTSGQEICGQLDSDNKNNNENVQYSANAKDEETNLENYVESMEVDVADVSVSATKSKVDIETDIQQTNITESDKPLESDLDTISLQANLHKPENSSEVKLDDHTTKHNNDKSFLRKRLRWSKEIKQDTVLNDNETQNDLNKPILPRKRSLRRAPIHLNDYEVSIKNSQRGSNAQKELLLNSKEDSRISHESKTEIEQANIELKHKKDDVIMDHHNKLNSLEKQVTDKKKSSVNSDAGKIEDESIRKDQINSDEQELSLQSTQEDSKVCLSLEIISHKETYQIDLNKQDIALVECDSKKDVDQPILTRNRSLRRHSKKNNDDSKAFDEGQKISKEVILQNAQENSNKECLSLECESPMEKSMIKLQETEKHDNILDQKDLSKPILTRKRSLRGRAEKKKDDDVINKSQKITNDDDLLLQSSQENMSILNKSLECESQMEKEQIETQEPKMLDNILDDNKPQQDLDQPILTRKRSSRRSEKRKDDDTIIKSQIKLNDDDLLLQSSQENISILNESVECESQIKKAPIESQEPKMQDNILDDYKTQQDLDQPVLTRKRSSRRSEKRKDDDTFIKNQIKTNDDDLLLQSSQENISILNESVECESQINKKAPIEAQEPKMQDNILNDYKTQQDLDQPGLTRKRSSRRSEKRKNDETVIKSEIKTIDDDLLLQSSQENISILNETLECQSQIEKTQIETQEPKMQDNILDEHKTQPDLDQLILTRKRSSRRSETRKADGTIIKTNADDLLLQSAQGNESHECESKIANAQIELQEPKEQDAILDDCKTQKDSSQPIVTRKRSLRRSEKKKYEDKAIKKSQIITNEDELSLQSAQENSNVENVPHEFEIQMAQNELHTLNKQDSDIDDCNNQNNLDQPIRKERLRRYSQVTSQDEAFDPFNENQTDIGKEEKIFTPVEASKESTSHLTDSDLIKSQIEEDTGLLSTIPTEKQMESESLDVKNTDGNVQISSEIHTEIKPASTSVNAIEITQPELEIREKDNIDPHKEEAKIKGDSDDRLDLHSQKNCVLPELEEDMEYGHLDFTEKITVQESTKKEVISTQITVNDNSHMDVDTEENEYDHLDFIFSSLSKQKQDVDIKSTSDVLFIYDSATNGLSSKEKVTEKILIDPEMNNEILKEKSLLNPVSISNSKQRELRVSVEKLPLNILSPCIINNCQDKLVQDNFVSNENKVSIGIDEDKLLNSEEKAETVAEEISNGHCNNVSDISADEELVERLILQDDSFEELNAENDENERTNDTKNDDLINDTSLQVVNDSISTDSTVSQDIKNISGSLNGDQSKEKSEVENRSSTASMTYRKSIETTSTAAIHTDNNTVNEQEAFSHNSTTSVKTPDVINKTTENIVPSINIDEFVTSVNRLPEPVKLNGFHIDECLDFSDGEFNAETSSINSEDSEPLSVTKSKLISKNRTKALKALDDPEFVKYLELRQDQLMDEHPELSQDEIVEYLYKTWQYEENAKPDLVKNDDFEQSGLVKGLNQNLKPKKSRNNFRDSKKRSKKRDEDSVSINSDISDTSVKRRLRTRMNKSPATSIDIEDNEIGLTKEMTLEIKTELLDNVSVNTDISSNSAKSPVDKSTDTHTTESKSVSPTNSYHASNKNASPDVEKYVKHSKVKDKTKSPKTKETTIKSYFKSTALSAVSEANHTDVEIQIDTLKKIKEEYDPDTASINSEDSEVFQTKRRRKYDKTNKSMTDPEFLKYVELRQDPLIDENPQLSHDEIVAYLYKTWLYEESMKPDLKKTDDLEQASLVKGLEQAPSTPQHKRVKKKIKVEKDYWADEDVLPKDKPKRKISQPYYNEDLSDIEDEIQMFEIFKPKKKLNMASDTQVKTEDEKATVDEEVIEIDEVDEVELYFSQLTEPKPNVFKGLVREKVCEICERTGNLVKCKGCNSMFHVDCAQKKKEVVEIPETPSRGRKKKKKNVGRKPKNLEDSESHSDEKSQDVSEEINASMEDDFESRTVNAEDFEAVLASKMQELLPTVDANYDSYSSDDGLDWNSAPPGKCEIIDVKLKPKTVTDHSNFKCINCQENSVPVCFVCKQAVSKTGVELRQRCQTAHCYNYYHLECLDHWPQTQFHAGEPSKSNKKINEHFESLMCPRHVCHTCVSDDPRGCKTRFSGDKLARCVRCPATYHSFTKCLPAGTQILTGSLIVCPRHYEHRPGKVPCHVNTGWCFICALGGSLICCEYCPTSFHAECLNIKPPEGGYMCEDCETGRLPLYGEMVWVKLGHYRWWPGMVLHPSEIPENIMAVKHSPGEFVVRFFGQYDHYWVNRGRVFPFQEGDSGRISSQKSKIDAAFTTAMEHAQRACEILKSAAPNEEESLDIASSLLPPHYVKLKVNKPCGSLCGRRVDVEESSLTQCECPPSEEDPCGPYSQCINRMLLTECGPSCRAGDRCNNRAFERRQYPRMAPYRTPSRGWGLKTHEDIRAGQFVIEYVGELIDEEEFRRRMNRKHEIRDENFYFLTLDKERMIDAGPKGNLARFMNHCCEPNCETQKWTVLGDVRVGLFALYDIPANSELTFNYNLECAGIEKKRCMCGAKRCSGYIGAKPKQEESQPKKSKLPGKRTYKKRKNVEESPSTSKNKPKRPVGRPAKPRELTEIEKDLLIIKNATNGLSSDSEGSGRLSSLDSEMPKALKRKRVSFSTEDCISKKARVDEKIREVGD